MSPKSSAVERNDGAHGLARRVESVNLLEPSVRHVPPHLEIVVVSILQLCKMNNFLGSDLEIVVMQD